MADYVKKIRTSTGDKQIDYMALGNNQLDPNNEIANAGGIKTYLESYLISKYSNAEVTQY